MIGLRHVRQAPRRLLFALARTTALAVIAASRGRRFTVARSSLPWVGILGIEDAFLKVSWRADAFAHELENRAWLAGHTALAPHLVPFRLVRERGLTVLESPRLLPIADRAQRLIAAETIHRAFRACGARRTVRIEELEWVRAGLDVLEELCGPAAAQACRRGLEAWLAANPLMIGPAHGDFHHGNVLRAADGTYALIDFDCVRRAGVQLLDAYYYILEAEVEVQRRSWIDLLADRWRRPESARAVASAVAFDGACDLAHPEWLLMLFVDRLGQERRFVERTADLNARRIRGAVEAYRARTGGS